MGMEVAARACFPSLSHQLLHSRSSYPSHHHHHQIISSVFASISSSPCSSSSRMRGDRRSPFLGAPLSKTRSLDIPTRAGHREKSLRRAISATSLPCFPDGDELQELAAATTTTTTEDFFSDSIINREPSPESNSSFVPPSCWPYDGVLGARPKNRAASNTDLMPVSLWTVKDNKKNRFEEDGSFRDACETARCSSSSVKRAFSSMVFIIRELQCYSLHQMRELSFVQDLQEEEEQQGMLSGRMQDEMHASFVWLFQHIFSCTPALMLSLMLPVANLSIYSMGQHAAATAPSAAVVVKEGLQQPLMEKHHKQQFSNSTIDTLEEEEEEEAALWKGIVDEARGMAGVMMDPEIVQGLVSPVTVEMEAEDEHAHVQTELMYRRALSLDPDCTLLLTNFAQFLYLVLHDYDRAESYFKLAVGRTEGEADAEALSRYASFLWLARKDLGAAEETFLEAIAAADPGNTYHAANYANFLWNTGGGDTCYPLDDDAMGDHGGGCVCS